MSDELKSISDRVCEEADNRLHRQLADAAEPIRKLFCQVPTTMKVTVRTINEHGGLSNDAVTAQVDGLTLLSNIKSHIFEQYAPSRRQQAVDEFMRKLEEQANRIACLGLRVAELETPPQEQKPKK